MLDSQRYPSAFVLTLRKEYIAVFGSFFSPAKIRIALIEEKKGKENC